MFCSYYGRYWNSFRCALPCLDDAVLEDVLLCLGDAISETMSLTQAHPKPSEANIEECLKHLPLHFYFPSLFLFLFAAVYQFCTYYSWSGEWGMECFHIITCFDIISLGTDCKCLYAWNRVLKLYNIQGRQLASDVFDFVVVESAFPKALLCELMCLGFSLSFYLLSMVYTMWKRDIIWHYHINKNSSFTWKC